MCQAEVLRCKRKLAKGKSCNGPIKPLITFFGEKLPKPFVDSLINIEKDDIDLLIVVGTALAVAPFNSLVDKIKCPQVLVNLTNTDEAGYDFDSEEQPHRLFLQGKCDDTLTEIAEYCGWQEELASRFRKT